jgi:hypothetical protein
MLQLVVRRRAASRDSEALKAIRADGVALLVSGTLRASSAEGLAFAIAVVIIGA